MNVVFDSCKNERISDGARNQRGNREQTSWKVVVDDERNDRIQIRQAPGQSVVDDEGALGGTCAAVRCGAELGHDRVASCLTHVLVLCGNLVRFSVRR